MVGTLLGGWHQLVPTISVVIVDRQELAGRWLEMAGRLPLAISKDCGCDSRSLQDGWEMIGWLAPTSSKDFGCNCRSPTDGWVVGPTNVQPFPV